jgi:hypothetical protein
MSTREQIGEAYHLVSHLREQLDAETRDGVEPADAGKECLTMNVRVPRRLFRSICWLANAKGLLLSQALIELAETGAMLRPPAPPLSGTPSC